MNDANGSRQNSKCLLPQKKKITFKSCSRYMGPTIIFRPIVGKRLAGQLSEHVIILYSPIIVLSSGQECLPKIQERGVCCRPLLLARPLHTQSLSF